MSERMGRRGAVEPDAGSEPREPSEPGLNLGGTGHGTGPARPWVSAGAVFADDTGRVLLVDPTYKDFWNLPGGGVDDGETPRAACVREIYEELGLRPDIGPLLLVAWVRMAGGGDKLHFVFDGGVLDADQRAAITLPIDELREYAFVPEESVPSLLSDWQARLMAEAVRARRTGGTRYLELAESSPG